MEEIWKVIDGTMNNYEVSNFGRVRKNGKICKIGIKPSGYPQLSIGFVYGRHIVAIHRLVAAYFGGVPSNYAFLHINHKDGVKTNNRIDNLEWCTPLENQHHRTEILGKHMRGDKNPMYGVKGKESPVFKGFIKMVNPKNGEVVKTFAGSGEAARDIGGIPSNIIRVINKPRTYHGYLWKREQQ